MDDLKQSNAVDFLSRVVYIAWYIWKARNEAIFNFTPLHPELTMKRALEAFHEFMEIKVPTPIHMDNPTIEDVTSHWRAPDQGFFMLNCDVATGKDGVDAKIAVTVRDWKGKLLDRAVKTVSAFSPFTGNSWLFVRRVEWSKR